MGTMVVMAVAVAVTGGVASALSSMKSKFLLGAISGAAGSAAGQLTGMALGVQSSFNWKQVAVSAMTAGVARGASAQITGSSSSWASKLVDDGALNAFERAVVGTGSALTGAAANKLIANQSQFSWANVAASAAGSAAGLKLPGEESEGFITDVANGILGRAVSYGTNRVFGGDDSWRGSEVLADAFGNAIGNGIVAGLSHEPRISKEDQNKINQGAQKLSQSVNKILDDKLHNPIALITPEPNSEDIQTPLGGYRHLGNRDKDIENLNQLNDGLKQDLKNKKRRFTEGPNPTRKPIRNRHHEDSYKLTNDGFGVDLSKEYDWGQILDNGKYLKEKRKPPFEINKIWDYASEAWDEFSILPDEGGFTFSQGLQLTGEALIYGGAVTYGDFYSFNFKDRVMTTGNFWSVQGGKDIGARQLALFGGEAFALFSIGAETVQAHQADGSRHIEGIGIAVGVAAPDISGHAHFGYGGIVDDSTVPVLFSDVPNYFFHRWTGNIFK